MRGSKEHSAAIDIIYRGTHGGGIYLYLISKREGSSVIKRIEWLRKQIESQKRIKNQYIREGNEIGSAGASRKIRQYEEELRRLI